VLPILFEGATKAVIELATVHRFTEVNLAFLDQLTVSIGAVFNTIEATMRTEGLLDQSQRLTVQLQSRQKELQQTNEELATKAKLLAEQNAERERSEEHIKQLLNEVDHRSKNVLSVVQAIARQTAITSPDEFVTRFSERMQTLAASHDLLVKSRWQGIEISDLIRVQLAHFKDLIGSRIKLDGPSLRLSVAAAQTLGMIMHELATNAAKYGALSNNSGCVEICWHAHQGEANDVFMISWTECGGPNVVAPSRRGFGSTVVKTMAESSLDGDVDLDFAPTGLRWRLVCPSSKALDEFAPRVR
jgi:two-component sensor histidine kinase